MVLRESVRTAYTVLYHRPIISYCIRLSGYKQESLFWRREVFPRCCHHQLICTWKVNGDGDRGADVKTDGRCLLVVTRLCVANRLQPMQCQCLFIYFWSRDYSVAYRWQPIKCRCFFLKDVGRTTYEDVLLCFCAVTLFIYLFNYQW